METSHLEGSESDEDASKLIDHSNAVGFGANLEGLQNAHPMTLFGGDDEEYLSEEEFHNSLNEQEKTIFHALVISINNLHMDRQKKFMKRREKYLEQNPLFKTDQLAMRQQMERQIQAQAQY